MSVAFVLVTVAVSNFSFSIGEVHVAFSPLLSCMMLGTIFCNICDFSEQLMDRLDRWTAPIYILFFVISGAELNLNVLSDLIIVLIGLVYIISRSCGKYFGANISASISHSESNIKKYLGITLLPQAGVALGMSQLSYTMLIGFGFGEMGLLIRSLTLFSVLIYELIGPYLTKLALQKAGEINPEGKISQRNVSEQL
jgi:Kef-type K+ transport system membrane component KefB